jgi:hypothetical protein
MVGGGGLGACAEVSGGSCVARAREEVYRARSANFARAIKFMARVSLAFLENRQNAPPRAVNRRFIPRHTKMAHLLERLLCTYREVIAKNHNWVKVKKHIEETTKNSIK